MLSFNEYIKENNNGIITLYHGVKFGDKFTEFDFENKFPYFYLTPEYSYALEYARGELSNVLEFQIDTRNIIDLTSFGVQDLIFSDFQKMFYKKTKIYFPADLKDFFPTSFWEIVRKDRLGHLSKRLKSNGIDGFKMLETFYHMSDWKNPSKDAKRVHESYVLLNNSPIII